MGQIIQIGKQTSKEAGPPRTICPVCRQIVEINLDIWKKNVSELFKVKCYKCHSFIFLGMIIVSHSELKGLLASVSAMIDAVNPQNKIIA